MGKESSRAEAEKRKSSTEAVHRSFIRCGSKRKKFSLYCHHCFRRSFGIERFYFFLMATVCSAEPFLPLPSQISMKKPVCENILRFQSYLTRRAAATLFFPDISWKRYDDMDFKGCRCDRWASKMDIKIAGCFAWNYLKNVCALLQTKKGECISRHVNQSYFQHYGTYSHAPGFEMMTMPGDKIGALICCRAKRKEKIVKAISDNFIM